MNPVIVQAQDRVKSEMYFYYVNEAKTVIIDPDFIYNDDGYAVIDRHIEDAINEVVLEMKREYLEAFTDFNEYQEALRYINDFYQVIY